MTNDDYKQDTQLLQREAVNALNKHSQVAPEGRITGWLMLSVLAAGLGSSFIFGYNIGVINVGGNAIKRWIATSQHYETQNLTTQQLKNVSDKVFLEHLSSADKNKLTLIWSFVGGLFPLGGLIGGLMTGFIADRFGRKGGMLLNLILTFVAGLLMFSSKYVNSYHVLLLGRFLIGINCGLNSGLAPMYLTEIAPVNYRGCFGSVNQLMVTLAILVANIFGFDFLLGSQTLWPYLLLFTIIPAIWQLITQPFCPESPKYLLISKGQHDRARNALVKLRQTSNVDAEINVMQEESNKAKASPKVTIKQLFRQPVLRWAMTLCIVMMLSQQLSGINAAMFYSTQIFENDAKLTTSDAILATLGVMLVNVLMTGVSTIIVDKAGRRSLHMAGMAGMLFATILLVVSLDLSSRRHEWAAYASILFVILFVISFATGPGSIPWFYVSECFEQGARGTANSIAVGVNWFAVFLIGLLFPPIQEILKQYTFLIFTFFLALTLAFIYKYLPETKGKTVEQVQSELKEQIEA